MKKIIVITLVCLCAWGAAGTQIDDSLVVWKTSFWEGKQLEIFPDGQYLAAATQSTIFILNPENGEILQQYMPEDIYGIGKLK